ncbi:MAG: hypothetical protein D6767_04705 [Candidatus Hydrogenedentota bacterium]|nr:MAG: hypothetical protein D6767_04705 [Candidatus Hydrogenedentota bacterium]
MQLTVLFILICLGSIYAAGTNGAEFLTINTDARMSAMGNASAAVLDDVDSLFWNPAFAGLTDHREVSLSSMKLNGFEDGVGGSKLISFGGIYSLPDRPGGVGPFKSYGNFGVTFLYADYGKVPVTTITPDAVDSFTPYNVAAGLSYGNRIKQHAFGINLKYIHQSIYTYSSSGMSADLGYAYEFNKHKKLKGLTMGASILHLGFQSPFIEVSDPLPLSFKMGAAYKFFLQDVAKIFTKKKIFKSIDEDALLSIDFTLQQGYGPTINLGQEFRFFDLVYLRTGVEILETNRAFTAGFGVMYNSKSGRYQVDFAWVPQRLLGDNFRVTFNYMWARTLRSGAINTNLPKKTLTPIDSLDLE